MPSAVLLLGCVLWSLRILARAHRCHHWTIRPHDHLRLLLLWSGIAHTSRLAGEQTRLVQTDRVVLGLLQPQLLLLADAHLARIGVILDLHAVHFFDLEVFVLEAHVVVIEGATGRVEVKHN